MTVAPAATPWSGRSALDGLTLASVASIGAGAIHAAAAGIHADHVGLTRLFVVLALAQIGAGVMAVIRPGRLSSFALIAINSVAVAGWLTTRLTGLDAIGGLETREAPQFADSACAGMGVVSVVTAIVSLRHRHLPATRPMKLLAGLAVSALVVPAMFSTTSHAHADTDHAHDATEAHDTTEAHDPAEAHDTTVGDGAPTVQPYDPSLPIDLSGTPGVTPAQQAAAENLIAVTLRYLPQWSDPAIAEAAGFHSIGDSGTGHEHFIQWDWIDDDITLDPNFPESLVYEPQPDGSKVLVSAMFMLPPDIALDDVPDLGGPLMQWHIHDDLCFTPGDAPQVRGHDARRRRPALTASCTSNRHR